MLRAILQDVTDRTFIRESRDIVEVTRGVFPGNSGREGLRSRDRSSGAEEITPGVGGVRGLSERADEDEIDVVRQLRKEILKAGVANEGNLMSRLAAPDANHLGHDTGQIRVHDARI